MNRDRNGSYTYSYVGRMGNYIGVIGFKGKYYAPLDGTRDISHLYEIKDDLCHRTNEMIKIPYKKLQQIKGYDEAGEKK